jgi:hypothetical protein
MKCSRCQHRFKASWSQPGPDGSRSPGLYWLGAGLSFGAALAALLLRWTWVPWLCVAAGALAGVAGWWA